MRKSYDPVTRRLLFFDQRSDAQAWDRHWSEYGTLQYLTRGSHFVVSRTRKYLPAGSRVLEGGCGIGDKVYALRDAGYDAHGVDFASSTVARARELAPDLPITEGDVKHLEFEDESFDGYWSLGVVEHFWEDYDEALREMFRILRPQGVLFLSVPTLSPLRRIKIALHQYPIHEDDASLEDEFYQFAFHPDDVVRDMSRHGFRVLAKESLSGVKGLKDEVRLLRSPLQWLFDSKPLPLRAAKVVLDTLVQPLTHHMTLFTFRKGT